MEKQLIWVFEWRKSVHYWWSYILFSPECKELTSMLDPLLYRWGVPPVVIRCVHWTMQMGVLLTWIMAQSTAIVMSKVRCNSQSFIPKDLCRPHAGSTQWSMWVCLFNHCSHCLSHCNFHNMSYKKVKPCKTRRVDGNADMHLKPPRL